MANLSGVTGIEKLVFFDVEAIYGIDATPGATQALLTEDFKLDAAKTDKQSRNIDRAGLGGTEDSVGVFSADVSFKIPLTSSGALGVAATFSDILRACQMNVVIDAGVSVTYNLVSGDVESGTFYYYKGERLRRLRGFRGSVGYSFKNGSIPYLMVSGQSLYAAGVDGQTPPTPNYGVTQTPIPVSYENTPVFTLAGTALVLINLDISAPSNTKHRDAPNQQEVRLSGRRDYSGKATVLQRDLADFNPEAMQRAGTMSELYVEHGVGAGNVCALTCANVQIVGVSEGEQDGDATWELDLNITATGAGDDDIILKLT